MKKILIRILSASLILVSGFICVWAASPNKNKTVDDMTPQERARNAFYIYSDFKSILNHYYPSGWMGDSRDLNFNQQHSKGVYAGKHCIKVQYNPRGSQKWSGIYWQQPSNNWGDKQGGYDLSKATYLTFWLKGETGEEVISEVKMGGFKGAFPDSGTAVKKNLRLTKDWALYWIDLRKVDTSYIAGGFCFVVNRKQNPNGCTFYMDEIRYEMNK